MATMKNRLGTIQIIRRVLELELHSVSGLRVGHPNHPFDAILVSRPTQGTRKQMALVRVFDIVLVIRGCSFCLIKGSRARIGISIWNYDSIIITATRG